MDKLDKQMAPTGDITDDAEQLNKIPDPKPHTWINEALWSAFFLMAAFYGATAVINAVQINMADPLFLGWSWPVFFIVINATMLPLFGAAVRAQTKGQVSRELDEERKTADELKREKTALISEKFELRVEIAGLRAELSAQCQLADVLKNANITMAGQIEKSN